MPNLVITQDIAGDKFFVVDEVTDNKGAVGYYNKKNYFNSYEKAQKYIDVVNSLLINKLTESFYYCTMPDLESFCDSNSEEEYDILYAILYTFPLVVAVGKQDFEEGVFIYSVDTLKYPKKLCHRCPYVVYVDESGNLVTLKRVDDSVSPPFTQQVLCEIASKLY